MTAAEAETILQYYADIPKRRRAVLRERAELEAQYSTLRGNDLDGMPHASGNSDGTADQALRMTEKDTARRLGELDVLDGVLADDRAAVRSVLDRLKHQHKELLKARYIDGHTWELTACRVGLSRRQTIRVSVVALTRFGVLLEELPMGAEILARARDAGAL